MKKNGFTLIELIAIIVVIALILLVSVPSLVKTINNFQNKSANDYMDNIYMIVEEYVTNNDDLLNKLNANNAYVDVYIRDLIEAGYFNVSDLDDNPVDMNINSRIRVTLSTSYKKYSYSWYR